MSWALDVLGIHQALAHPYLLGYIAVHAEHRLPGLVHLAVHHSPHAVYLVAELGELLIYEFYHIL